MTLLGSLFERRSLENPNIPLSGTNFARYLGIPETDSGIAVNETTAMNIAAVWQAVSVTAGVASSLPLKSYRRTDRKRVVVRLLENPHPDMTPKELWETVYVHLLLWGNAYLLKVRNPAGMVTWLLPIHPSCVKVGRVTDWEQAGMVSPKVYEVSGWTDRRTENWTDYEVLHIPGLGSDGTVGMSPIAMARQSLGITAAAERQAARQWASGAMLSGILQSDQKLSDDQAKAVKARWHEMLSSGRGNDIAVLGSGATFNPISMPNDDAQFLESRVFQVTEVCRWFGLPPHMNFEVSGSTSWGTGIEQQTIGWHRFTLLPKFLDRVEARLTKEASPAGVYVEYDADGLQRGDSASQAAYFTAATGGPWMAGNEARIRQNLPPVDGLDTILRPLNMGPAGEGTTDPATGQTSGDADADEAA